MMVRLMKCTGDVLSDARLEKDGDWGPQHFFGTVHFDDIVKVENNLVEM